MRFICIYLLVCACIGLSYGLAVLFRKKPPTYFKLIIFVMASLTLSRAFYLIDLLCYGELPDVFNIGFVGFAIFFLFLFYANSGEIDSLVDENDKMITKYRLIPIILPAAEIIVSIYALLNGSADISVRISYVVLSAIAGLAGYLNMKHLIIKDVEGGIVRTIRGFNLLCIMLEMLTLAEVCLSCFEIQVFPVQIASGIIYIILLPMLNKEVRKWTI